MGCNYRWKWRQNSNIFEKLQWLTMDIIKGIRAADLVASSTVSVSQDVFKTVSHVYNQSYLLVHSCRQNRHFGKDDDIA